MKCLGTMWLKGPKGGDHQERLESFYAPQAEAYDRFRSAFLWGRKPMLAACAARVQGQRDMVWVDLGGGTAENVSMMEEFISLSHFQKIYVVDLTPSLCKVAEEKVTTKTEAKKHFRWLSKGVMVQELSEPRIWPMHAV